VKKRVLVKIRGREGKENAYITKEKWTLKGKKRDVFIVRDRKGTKLARSTKIKSFNEAKEIFERRGTLNEFQSIFYFSKTKEVSKDIRTSKALKRQPKTLSGFYQFTSVAYLPNGKKIIRSSNKYPIGKPIAEAKKEANNRLLSELSDRFGEAFDVDCVLRIKNVRKLPITSRITYFTKR